MSNIERIAQDLGFSAKMWDADVRLLGDVTAMEIRDLCQWVIEHNGPATGRNKTMKTQKEIEARIKELMTCKHVLTVIGINPVRVLMKIEVETELQALHWVLDTEYHRSSKM
jgi:hypothetical protein